MREIGNDCQTSATVTDATLASADFATMKDTVTGSFYLPAGNDPLFDGWAWMRGRTGKSALPSVYSYQSALLATPSVLDGC